MRTIPVLWTIQPVAVWETLRSQGVVHVDPGRIAAARINPQYRWLTKQLARRLSTWEGLIPWWFYCRRPDLRQHRHIQRGDQVLIEVVPPSGTFLSFSCWAWHEVFCMKYLSISREDEQQWQRDVAQATGLPAKDAMWSNYTQELRRKARKSWSRLFDPDLPVRSWRKGWLSTSQEAVMESIRMDWVRCTTAFEGASRR